ncbi:hypothetical protein HYV89_01335 [Candidatus Woesearchaeota archaeon]|nr:hypothetical protein [Candidatus Woesearchaeota archaeon]
MNKVELTVKYYFSEWGEGKDKRYYAGKAGDREEKLNFDLASGYETNRLINLLRVADEDYDKRFGARDKNLRYEILEITFLNSAGTGMLTREALDNKIGYNPIFKRAT